MNHETVEDTNKKGNNTIQTNNINSFNKKVHCFYMSLFFEEVELQQCLTQILQRLLLPPLGRISSDLLQLRV